MDRQIISPNNSNNIPESASNKVISQNPVRTIKMERPYYNSNSVSGGQDFRTYNNINVQSDEEIKSEV